MIYTTLNRIREHAPSDSIWRQLLAHLSKTEADDEPLAYDVILETVGLDATLWCLRAEPQHANIWRMYAVRAARSVQHLMKDERSVHALDAAERHARGEATDSELAAARDAARAVAWAETKATAEYAAWAAWSAARDAAHERMTADFRALLASHEALPGESCALNEWGADEFAATRASYY